jgi:Carboxypeptidase regulatory-like domain
MNSKAAKFIPGLSVLLLSLLISAPSFTQVPAPALAGSITGPSGAGVPNATVTAKNLATNQSTQTHTDSAGSYGLPNLTPGDYEVSVSAAGFDTKVAKLTLAPGATQTINLALTPSLSLQDLGFPQAQTQGNPQEQALLNKRSHMLKVHQRLGLITTIPMVATVVSGAFAGGRATSSTNRDLHAAFGSLTAGLYFTTAYYAIFAPKVPGVKARGPIRLHKALAWIHGPGMILTPILGEMAFAQRSRGERVYGIARAHGQVAIVTAAAFGLAILSVSIKPGFFSRSAHDVHAFFDWKHSPSAGSSADAVPGAPQ